MNWEAPKWQWIDRIRKLIKEKIQGVQFLIMKGIFRPPGTSDPNWIGKNRVSEETGRDWREKEDLKVWKEDTKREGWRWVRKAGVLGKNLG